MSGQMDVDRLLESWFADGPTELPDRVIDSIVANLTRTNSGGRSGARGENK